MQVELQGDALSVFVPGTDAEGHHITIPLTLDGLRILRKILRERKRESAPRIGMAAAPTQYQVDAWLRAAAQEEAKAKSKDLGIDVVALAEELGL